jgi:holo-[acyl-carrier protein] synthase
MIAGVGIDLVSNERLHNELVQGSWRASDGIFTASEISHCDQGRRPARCYASCFAAKEATLKAMGMCVTNLGLMSDVEIELDRSGAANVTLRGQVKAECERLGVKRIKVSVASTSRVTGAMVILEI